MLKQRMPKRQQMLLVKLNLNSNDKVQTKESHLLRKVSQLAQEKHLCKSDRRDVSDPSTAQEDPPQSIMDKQKEPKVHLAHLTDP